jgi:hypothetical protein
MRARLRALPSSSVRVEEAATINIGPRARRLFIYAVAAFIVGTLIAVVVFHSRERDLKTTEAAPGLPSAPLG